jgi:Ca-activated chloride channel family protein
MGLRLESENIKVEINDQVAKTYITQTFANDTDRNLAGTYLFPLPEDTTFSSFSLHIDGKPVEGKILEASEARQQYEEIVRRMVDPGLLEYADYKTVRARIFPIPAHGTKKVELEYTQVLRAENGLLKYRFPLKSETESSGIENVNLSLKIASKQGLRTIWSPSHEVTAKKLDEHRAQVTFDAQGYVPDKDFLLYYSVSDKELAVNELMHRTGGDGYFLFSVTPPSNSNKTIAKDIVLAVDTSGSMQGEKIQQAKKALKFIVNALNADDKFGLVQFNTDVESYKTDLVSATPENKRSASEFIDNLEAHGGTNIGDALSASATMLNKETTRPGYVILLTDGEPTVGDTRIDKLMSRLTSKRDVRLFDFGVGYDVNTKLLNKLAEAHHGYSQYVEPKEDLETAMSSFYQKIKSPVLSNVKITFDGGEVKDVYPREVKDIFAGTQVLLIGKYKAAGKSSVHLTGTVNGLAKSYVFPIHFANEQSSHTYLPRLWAMRRIGHLTEVAQENSENREVVDEIVSLSKQYGIITQYTSFLVTDPSEKARLAMGLPAGRGGGAGSGGTAGRPLALPSPAPVVGLQRQLQTAFAPGFDSPHQLDMTVDRKATSFKKTKTSGALDALSNAGFSGSSRQLNGVDFGQVNLRQKEVAMSSGQAAVSLAKDMNGLKSSTVAYNGLGSSESIKVVEDKTFWLVDGIWTDSSYAEKPHSTTIKVAFGSKAYFELIHKNAALAKYLSVGQQVILVFKDSVYQITKPVSERS